MSVSSKMINFATIGTSWITSSWIDSAQSTQKWKLDSVYSRSAETAKTFASKYHVTKIHTDLKQLAADPGIKAVYIASPNSLHFEQAKLLLLAGKHVIVEKPACSTENELDLLFKIAKDNGVFLLEALRHIHEVNFKILKSNLEKLGPIYGASLNYASFSSRYNNVLKGEIPNIFNLDYSGGSLVDLGVYPISAAIALFGPPKAQTYKPFIIKSGADGGGVMMLYYETFGVSINASKIYTSTAPSEVYGEKGTLRCNGITDIASVEFWEASTKKSSELAQQKASLNMSEEANEYARIINESDQDTTDKLEQISKATQRVTEELRRENGIIFGVEKDPVEQDR
jgi:predicted dehydrogenase